MNKADVRQIIRQIHRSPWKLMATVSGGGSEAISSLLAVPGASDTVLEAMIPYAVNSLADFLKFRPAKYCSSSTAKAMAMRSFLRARRLNGMGKSKNQDESHLIGLGCSASLRSQRPKRGDHRVHIAIQTAKVSSIASLVLTKDTRDREREEQVVSALIINRLADVMGIPDRLDLELLPGEHIVEESATALPDWSELLLGQRIATCSPEQHRNTSTENATGVLFPGAFNPLHEGHLRIVEVAEAITGRSVDFEISIENVDKPPLDFFDIHQRVAQFEQEQRCWLTRASTFQEKAQIFPETQFVVGADTIARIADQRYYGQSTTVRDGAIDELRQQNCRFLVFPRVVTDDFLSLDDIDLPTNLRSLCEGVSPEQFRMDISSSEIRSGTT